MTDLSYEQKLHVLHALSERTRSEHRTLHDVERALEPFLGDEKLDFEQLSRELSSEDCREAFVELLDGVLDSESPEVATVRQEAATLRPRLDAGMSAFVAGAVVLFIFTTDIKVVRIPEEGWYVEIERKSLGDTQVGKLLAALFSKINGS